MSSFDTIAHTLDEADAAARNADLETVRAKLGQLRALVGPGQLLTTGEAAILLSIRSVNTVKALARAGKIPFLQEPGKQMRLPLAGVLDFRATRDFRHLAASERAHDETADLGNDTIPPEAREDMVPAPGSLPWQRR